ncbi:hypothetical protein NNRS527_02072 [Nitrosospira sp. NRS527]|nr:hypothetical protein NNRS527_02072 [Nitrosospira sp. NRS527]
MQIRPPYRCYIDRPLIKMEDWRELENYLACVSFNCLASMSRADPIRDNGLAENEKSQKGSRFLVAQDQAGLNTLAACDMNPSKPKPVGSVA